MEQGELRDAAARLLAGVAAASPEHGWQTIVQAGWPALTAPESLGGLEQDLTAACALYVEVGRALSPAPLLACLLAVEALGACDPSAARNEWIERVAGGELVAVSLLDPEAPAARGGVVRAVLGAGQASHALVFGDGRLAMVPLNEPGVEIVARPTWDVSRVLFDLHLDDALFGNDALVLAQGRSAQAARAAFSTHLHFAIAADCIGAAEEILHRTVAYLITRRQFDRPLAMFQALKHRCADLEVMVRAAAAVHADYLEDFVGLGVAERTARARGAKSIASSAFRTVAEEAVQLHGGMGMTAEHPCHLFLKRALLNEQLASPDDACDIAVGRALFDGRRVDLEALIPG